MQIGMNHLHTNLAHLLVLCALVGVVLAVLGASRKPGLAALMDKNHTFGVLMLGRLIYVAGFGLAMATGHSFLQPWILAGILLWGVVEVAAKRLIKPEVEAVIEGGVGSYKLLSGAALQLLVIVTVYGLMQMKPAL